MEGSSSSVGLDLYREGEYNSGEPQLQGSMSVPIAQAGGSAGVGAGAVNLWPVLITAVLYCTLLYCSTAVHLWPVLITAVLYCTSLYCSTAVHLWPVLITAVLLWPYYTSWGQ